MDNKPTIGSIHWVSCVNAILDLWQMAPQVLKFGGNVSNNYINMSNVWNVADCAINTQMSHFGQ